jgi:hypothetical protein
LALSELQRVQDFFEVFLSFRSFGLNGTCHPTSPLCPAKVDVDLEIFVFCQGILVF